MQGPRTISTDCSLPPVEVLVCTTCRREEPADEGVARPGARLHAALTAAPLPAGVRVKGVACLSNCKRGCSIVLRGAGRWTYVYGDLDPAEHAATILAGAARYQATADGLVPWRDRPEHFRKHCIARIPPLDAASPEGAD